MTRKRTATRLRKLFAVAASTGLLAGGVLLTAPGLDADQKARGSVRHSSAANKKKGTSTARPGTRPSTPATRQATPARRQGARAGYRAGYRQGRHAGYNDARREYRRWRTITGLFKLGVYMATRPPRSTTVVVTGTTYYYAGGVYYVPSGSGYVVVAAPPGGIVYAVPTATTVVYVGTTPYYYYGGTYYVTTTAPAQPPPPPDTSSSAAASGEGVESLSDVPMIEDDENYEVVAPPVGATVPYIPDEADEETVNGKAYFVHDGTYYRPFASDGETIYMVVEDPRQQA